jgi:predicted enzyme related to lactoylglutathione lyase
MPARIGWPTWIGVVAEDMAAQAAFYRDALGFRQTEVGEDSIQFEVDGNILEVLARSSLPQYDARRVQVGFEVDDIERARDELIAAGVEPISGIEGDEGDVDRWAYFRDPEGNVFELTQRERRPA